MHTWLGEGLEGGKRDTSIASLFGGVLHLLCFQSLQLPFQTQQETKPSWRYPPAPQIFLTWSLSYPKLLLSTASPEAPSSFLAAAHGKEWPPASSSTFPNHCTASSLLWDDGDPITAVVTHSFGFSRAPSLTSHLRSGPGVPPAKPQHAPE